jgi:hypothetical protein
LVQDHFLPAGEYNIFTVLPERAIRIASTDGRYSAIVNTLPNYAGSPAENSRLIFHRNGDEYFLTIGNVIQPLARPVAEPDNRLGETGAKAFDPLHWRTRCTISPTPGPMIFMRI